MSEPTHAVPVDNPDVRHETSDVNVRAIVLVAVGMVVLAVVLHVGIWGVFEYYKAREERHKRPVFPLAARDAARPIDQRLDDIGRGPTGAREPRLEGLQPVTGPYPYTMSNPLAGAESARTASGTSPERLSEYGWVDRGRGLVHIPIDKAIQILVERGTFRTAHGAKPLPPASSGEANSGRGAGGGKP